MFRFDDVTVWFGNPSALEGQQWDEELHNYTINTVMLQVDRSTAGPYLHLPSLRIRADRPQRQRLRGYLA